MKELYKLTNQNLNDKSSGQKRLNIFLTKDQYKKLLDLKYKYRLQFSFIARIITSEYKLLKPLDIVINADNLYKTTNKKTSIKISKNENYNSREVNNALIIFLEKKDKELLDPKIYQKLHNQIHNLFQNTVDELWQYNEIYRNNYLANKFINK